MDRSGSLVILRRIDLFFTEFRAAGCEATPALKLALCQSELKMGTTLGETKTQVLRLASAATDWEVRRTQEFSVDNA
jgi:hypothetical protein